MTAPGPAAPPPPVPPTPALPRSLRLGDLLVGAGALVVFGFSFAPFIEYDEQTAVLLFGLVDISFWFSAWSLQTFLVPVTTFVIVAVLLAAGSAAVRFGLRRDPDLLGFRLRQLEVGLALFAAVVLLGMVASDKHAVVGARRLADADPNFNSAEVALDTGWGAVLMLIGAIVALVGALLNHFEVGPAIAVGGSEPPVPPPPPGAAWQARPVVPPPPPPGPPPAPGSGPG